MISLQALAHDHLYVESRKLNEFCFYGGSVISHKNKEYDLSVFPTYIENIAMGWKLRNCTYYDCLWVVITGQR